MTCIGAVLAAALSGAAAAPVRVLILDPQSGTLPPAVTQPLQAAVVRTLSQHGGYELTSPEEVRKRLNDDRIARLRGCKDDARCMTDLAGDLKPDLILRQEAGKIGDTFILNLTLIHAGETAGGAGRGRASAGSIDQLAASVPAALSPLFGWSKAEAKPPFKLRLKKGEQLSFAVFDLKSSTEPGQGLPEATMQQLTEVIPFEVKKLDGTKVISRQDIVNLLAWDKFKKKCGFDDPACIAEIGGNLGANKLITGRVGKLDDSYVIQLQLLDVHGVGRENETIEMFAGSERELVRATQHAVRDLLGVEITAKGQLRVTADEPSTEVFVDGDTRGKVPLDLQNLVPGKHALRLTKDNYYDWQSESYVDPFYTTNVEAKLTPRPERWYQKWWVWTAAGAVLITSGAVIFYETRPPPSTGSGTVRLP